MMQVVILAGGLGTRLRSVAADIPKVLVPVAGRPFIEHQFALLRQAGFRRVLLSIGHLGDHVRAHVGDGSRWGMEVAYAEEDPARLLGTGGALVNALPLLEPSFLVMYGDSYLPVDYAAFARWFLASGRAGAMTVYRNEGKWDASNTRIADGRVVFYSKKAKPGEADYIDYGLSAFRREVIARYAAVTPPLDLAVVMGDLVTQEAMGAYEVRERFYEVGKPEGWAELDALLSVNGAPAVFVDRDGTLNEMVYDEVHGLLDSPRKPEQVVLLPGAGAFLKGLRELGYRIVVVTNQPGIAKGTLTVQDLEAVNARLADLLAEEGGRWDDLFYSPYHPKGGPWARPEYVRDTACRKPAPGMLLEAAQKHELDVARSWMVGDGLVDVQAGRRAGCRTILLCKAKLQDIERFVSMKDTEPDFLAGRLAEALQIIEREGPLSRRSL